MCAVKLKQLVDELVSLNDENLARRVIETSDVQWCLSELQDMLADDLVVTRWIKVSEWLPIKPNEPYGRRFVIAMNGITVFPAIFEHVEVKERKVLRWKWWEDTIYDGRPIVAWLPLPEPPKDMEE